MKSSIFSKQDSFHFFSFDLNNFRNQHLTDTKSQFLSPNSSKFIPNKSCFSVSSLNHFDNDLLQMKLNYYIDHTLKTNLLWSSTNLWRRERWHHLIAIDSFFKWKSSWYPFFLTSVLPFSFFSLFLKKDRKWTYGGRYLKKQQQRYEISITIESEESEESAEKWAVFGEGFGFFEMHLYRIKGLVFLGERTSRRLESWFLNSQLLFFFWLSPLRPSHVSEDVEDEWVLDFRILFLNTIL